MGFASAKPMEATRRVLEERKAAGLAGGMQFTYRNPTRSTDPGRVLPGAAALVVGAWAYGGREAPPGDGLPPGDELPPGEESAPHLDGRPKGIVARYARRDHYGDLRTALGTLADVLKARGWAARVLVDDNALVDRAAAQAAGLGWFGKNCSVLLPQLGSWFVLGSVVTDAPLPSSVPVHDGCGACRRCLGSCPTGALVAPGVLDARRCLAWLLQAPGIFPFAYREALGARIYGCDDCQEACPANKLPAGPRTGRAAPGNSAPGSAPGRAPGSEPAGGGDTGEAGLRSWVGREVDVLEMLSASGPELMARYGGWYVPQRDPRYLRRNALLVLANTGDGRSQAVGATLACYLSSPDEMLRARRGLGRRQIGPAGSRGNDARALWRAVAAYPRRAQPPERRGPSQRACPRWAPGGGPRTDRSVAPELWGCGR